MAQGDVQVCAISTTQSEEGDTIETLLRASPVESRNTDNFAEEQLKDQDIKMLRDYFEKGMLPEDKHSANKVIAQAPLFTLADQIIYFIDTKQNNLRRVVVPHHLKQQIMNEYHSSMMSGHFSGVRLYNTLSKR